MSSPSKGLRRPLIAAAALVGALAFVVAARISLHTLEWQTSTLHPARRPVTSDARAIARATMPGVEDVSFVTSDGVTIRAWYVPPRNGAAIVLVHGLRENRARFLPEGGMFARHGFGALMIDMRAHGESGGDLSTWGDRERRDVTAAIEFLSGRAEVRKGAVGLLGFSVGASPTALVGAVDKRVGAVLLHATWTDLESETRFKMNSHGLLTQTAALFAMWRESVDVDAVRPIDHMGEIAPRPLLMITGSDDHDTPPAIMRRLFDVAREPKVYWEIPGVGHGDYAHAVPAEYEQRMIEFFQGALLPKSLGN